MNGGSLNRPRLFRWRTLGAASLILVARPAAQSSFDVELLLNAQGGVGFEFGRATCIVDVDLDGFADVVALESGASNGSIQWSGKGWVFYGPTLDSKTSFTARAPGRTEFLGGGGCCTGDVNGDGWPDLLVGSPDYIDQGKQDAGRAHVFLGPDYQVDIPLFDPAPEANARMGDHGLLLHDVDGDGLDDVFVGCIRHDQRLPDGTMFVNSGRVYHWPAKVLLKAGAGVVPILIENPVPTTNGSFGIIIMPAGDRAYPTLLASMAELVLRLDTKNFELLGTTSPPPIQGVSQFGTALATGQLGPSDEFGLLVTAIGSSFPGCGNAGAAFVLTGPDFVNLAFTLLSPDVCNGEKQYFGTRVLVFDVNRDGQEDIVISDPSKKDIDLVRIFWGPDYASFETLGLGFDPIITTGFGSYLAHGDIDADGFDEVAIYTAFGGDNGGLYIYDWRTLKCDVETASIATGGDAHFTLDLSPLQAGKTYLAALGISGSGPGFIAGKGSYVPLNIDAVTLAGLTLLNTPLLKGFTGALDAEGRANFTLHLPGGFPASLAGSTLTVAAVVIDSSGRPGAGSSPVHIVLTP